MNVPYRIAPVLVVLCMTAVVSRSFAQQGSIESAALSRSQKQWMGLIDPWLDAVDKRYTAAAASRARMSTAVDSTIDDAQSAAFIEHALSSHSQLLRVRSGLQWRSWLKSRFLETLCPLDAIDNRAKAELARLEKELSEIDSGFLIEQQQDVEVDSRLGLEVFPRCNVRYDRINGRVEAILDRLEPHIERAHLASAVKFGAETAVGIAADRVVRQAATDEDGEVSTEAAVLAFGIGLLADAGAQEVLDAADETPLRLEEALQRELPRLRRDVRDLIIAPETIVADRVERWDRNAFRFIQEMPAEGEFTIAVRRHNYSVRYSIADALSIDREWTGEVTEAAYHQRKASK